ncbi:MAG: cold shock domain-containing protein [Bacteroidetes bacterium]|nr:cold shock domain-containing protein [Bacteroidota bacterium]
MKKGKLKFYNRFKGYGLIKDFETGEEYNVSPAGMQDALIKDGDNVIFEVTEGRNGMNAVDIRLDTFILNT